MADPKLMRAVLQRFRSTTVSATVPALVEARVAWAVSPNLPTFISGNEGAICDAALVVDGENNTQLEDTLSYFDSTDRLLYVLQRFKKKRVFLPIDFKSINPHHDHWRRGACYNYAVGASSGQEQSDCALFLISNPAAPHLIAVVPRDFLDRVNEDRNGKTRYWRSMPVSGGKIEPFPMEISPLVIPIEFLAEALREYIAFYHHPERGW